MVRKPIKIGNVELKKKQRLAMEKANVNYAYQSVYEITYSFLKKILDVE